MQPKKTITRIEDTKFDHSYRPEDSTGIFAFQRPYYLEEKDYLILTKTSSKLEIWAQRFFIATATMGITTSAKYVYSLLSKQVNDIKGGELIAFVITLIIGLIFTIIDHYYPTDRKILLRKIFKYFKENQSYIGNIQNDT